MRNKTICLNMIVKNEAHIILETLGTLLPYVDYFVINDTGSTDGTQQVIYDFFNKHNIKGEVIDHEFRTCTCHMEDKYKKSIYSEFFHFGWNRTYSLQKCVGKSDYIFIMDADDLLVGNPDFSNLTADKYNLNFGENFTYYRPLIIKNDPKFNWCFKEPLHEYLTNKNKITVNDQILPNCHIVSRSLGARGKDPNKFVNDANVFEKYIIAKPKNGRSYFYCANSYFDGKQYLKAIEFYNKRIAIGGWYEETVYSHIKICMAHIHLNSDYKLIKKAALDSYKYCNKRSESLFSLIEYALNHQEYEDAYKYASIGITIPLPKDLTLFIHNDVYNWKMMFVLCSAAFYVNKFIEAATLATKLLNIITEKDNNREYVEVNNILYKCKDKIKEHIKPKLCVYHNHNDDNVDNLYTLIKTLYLPFNIIFISNNPINFNNIIDDDKNNVLSLTIDQLKSLNNPINVDYLIVYDSLNYFLDNVTNIQVKCMKILYLNDEYFKVCSSKSIHKLLINNVDTIKNIINNVNYTVIMNDVDIASEFAKNYNISDDTLLKNNVYNYKNFIQLLLSNENNTYDVLNHISSTNVNKLYLLENDNVFINTEELLNTFNKKSIDEFVKQYPKLIDIKLKKIMLNTQNYNKMINDFDVLLKDKDYKFNLKYNQYIFTKTKAKILYENNNYLDSFQLVDKFLNSINHNDISLKEYSKLEMIKYKNVDFLHNNFIVYQTNMIKNITNKLNNNNNNKNKEILFSITSCKRYDLFEKTVNSIVNAFEDIHKIDTFLCVDDNSSEADRLKMKQRYPFFTFIFKTESEKGHVISMNMIRKYALDNNYKYIIHCEDDFLFFHKQNYVTNAMNILKLNPMYGQILFNKNYAEVELHKKPICGGILMNENNMNYVIHEYCGNDKEKYNAFNKKYNYKANCAYWPHFSFRPGMWNVKMLQDLGEFYKSGHFEMRYAEEYTKFGYVTTFFNAVTCLHIGKKTWEQSDNSYTLNNTEQFVLNNKLSNISYFVTSKNNIPQNDWNNIKTYLNNLNITFTNQIPTPKLEITDFELKNFKYCCYYRDVIANEMLELNILLNNPNKNILILNDNVVFNNFTVDVINNLDDICDYMYFDNPDCHFISSNYNNLLIKYSMENNVYNLNKLLQMCPPKNKLYSNTLQTNNNIIIKTHQYVPKHKEFTGYEFYSQLDHFGYDFFKSLKNTVDEYYFECELFKCDAFNTYGYIKDNIPIDNKLQVLTNSINSSHGIYVKLE